MHSVPGYAAGNLKEKLSHQLENIVKKTEKNLKSGVYKNPNLNSFNQIGSGLSPNYRANSLGGR